MYGFWRSGILTRCDVGNLKTTVFSNLSFATPKGLVMNKFINVLLMKGIGAALSFLWMTKIANLFGSAGIGFYSLVVQVSIFASVFLRFGSDILILRERSKLKITDNYSVLIANFFVGRFYSKRIYLFLFLVCSSLLISDQVFNNKINYFSVWVLLASPIVACFAFFSSVLMALNSIQLAVFLQSILVPLLGMCIFFFDISRSQNFYSLVGYVFANLCALCVCILVLKYKFKIKNFFVENKKIVDRNFKDRLNYFFISISDFVILNLDIIVVGFFCRIETAGIYAVASRIAVVGGLYSQAVDNFLTPKFARLYAEKQIKSMRSLYVKFILLSFFAGIGLLCLVKVFSSEILSFFGDDFLGAGYILVSLTTIQFIIMCCSAAVPLLLMCKEEVFLKKVQIITSILYAVFLLILVPKFGVHGCIASLVLGPTISRVILIFYSEYLFKVKWSY
jgi:O-antigen/teichoic acid export membrane protein